MRHGNTKTILACKSKGLSNESNKHPISSYLHPIFAPTVKWIHYSKLTVQSRDGQEI